jgi:nucleoid DNA-binding protein
MENPEVDRKDLAFIIAERSGISPVEALESLKHLGPAIADALVSHGRAEIHGFGTFRLEDRAPRTGVMVGIVWETLQRQEIVFEAWPSMAEIVATRTGIPTY